MKKIVSPITGKSKYLLIENCEVVSQIHIGQDLKESLKLSAGKAGTLIVKNLPGTILNRENQNGRIYSTEVVAQAIRDAKPLLETKQLISSAHEHPEGSFVAPTDAAHVVTNAYIKKNVKVVVDGEPGNFDMLFLDIEVLNTQEGKNLRALLEAECSIGTSIRGVGDMEGKYVKNYEFLGIDFVGNPSSSTYTRMPVSESVKVEMKDPREMKETFTVTTSSTNVVRDLDQAAVLQQQLDGLGYGTVTKTSTKLDQETDPKTGAQTSIATLEAETSDDVSNLDQALQMAKNAMLNGTIHVDSITIENIPEEGETKEAIEAACEYVPEKTTLKEKPVTEAKKEDEEDPNLGKKFVLHTDRGFVTFDKNAIDFTNEPKDALHFTEGKEENGMVSMSKVIEILDAMGIFEVEKYFQKNDINLGAEEKPKDECGRNCMPKIQKETAMTEENGSNTKYTAQVTINDQNGSNNETISVSAVDLDSAKNEIANLYDMKAKGLNGNGTVDIILIDTITGEQLHYNPESQLLENKAQPQPVKKAVCSRCEKEVDANTLQTINNSDEELCPTCADAMRDSTPFEEGNDSDIQVKGNKLSMELDKDTTVEKEVNNDKIAQVVKAGIDNGTIDPAFMVTEEYDETNFEDPVICSWCKDMFEKSDCKREKDMGWLCDQCQRALESRGVELEFDDNMIEANYIGFNSTQNTDGTTTHTCDTTATYDRHTGDFTCGEDVQNEKLYSEPSIASDEYEKEPLEDAITEDFIVTLGEIDWNIDNVDPKFLSKIESLPDTIDVRIQGTTIDTADSPEDLKAAILAGANETMYPFGFNNGTIVSIKDTKTGEELM